MAGPTLFDLGTDFLFRRFSWRSITPRVPLPNQRYYHLRALVERYRPIQIGWLSETAVLCRYRTIADVGSPASNKGLTASKANSCSVFPGGSGCDMTRYLQASVA